MLDEVPASTVVEDVGEIVEKPVLIGLGADTVNATGALPVLLTLSVTSEVATPILEVPKSTVQEVPWHVTAAPVAT
jgi:hypothetical protein